MSGTTSEAVRAAHARWDRERRRLIKLGRWEPTVDAAPVRAHVRKILAAGMTDLALCRVNGLADGALRHLLYGWTDEAGVRRMSEAMSKETAEVLMAYWPVLDDFPDNALIDPCGFRRRVQALMVKGITQRVLAPRLGVLPRSMGRLLAAERVRAQLARAARDLYDEWWDRTPEELGVPPVSAARQVNRMEASGYLPALAWDDDTIDDPAAVPVLDAARPEPCRDADAVDRWLLGESVVLDDAGRRAALQYLMEWTPLTIEEVATRMGADRSTVRRQWDRIIARAKADGAEVPRRRVYVQPERPRPLRAGEMRRAA